MTKLNHNSNTMKKDSKNLALSDLSKEEQILFLGAELVKLKDLLMVTLDQMNRLNSYRNILSDILEETGIISHKELDSLANEFYKDAIKRAKRPDGKGKDTVTQLEDLYKETGVLTIDEIYAYVEEKYKYKMDGIDDLPEA